ncbi:MAG: aminotransferase class V-fold PLP-dependent enzyme, partial [bacterium]
SPEKNCLPGTLNVSIPGVFGQQMVQELDRAGICISSGPACSEGKEGPSHVILALSRDEGRARTCIRFSLGTGNTPEEVDQVSEIVPRLVPLLIQKGS